MINLDILLVIVIIRPGFLTITFNEVNITMNNLEKGRQYLEENKNKHGVKTTTSGLQYQVIVEGSGSKPSSSDTVTVHYTGRHIDGKVFDSSVERGTPATFPLSNVIPGWTEGVRLMGVGSKYKFFIPSELGYGANGAGGIIGPNEALIFDVELISIEGK